MKKSLKKSLFVIALIALAGAVVFAAGVPEITTIEGKLAITDNLPTIVSGGKTYVLPPGPFYQIAWTNGVKVGDTIKIEGILPSDNGRMGGGERMLEGTTLKDAQMIMPSKVWVNGKAIDLSAYEAMGPGGMGGMGRDDDDDRGPRGGSRGGRR